MVYKSIYPCWVIDEIRKGKRIFVLDRKMKSISYVNDASVEDVVRAIDSAEAESGRYDFWYEDDESEVDDA